MSTNDIADLAYRIRIELSMDPTPGTNELALVGPRDFDAASALINAGLELLLFLGSQDPMAKATATVLVSKLTARFAEALSDSNRPKFRVVD